ncbi:hypothetical protein [Nonomuraea rhodomycinica]|uniref:Lipoprotein n=1 Tax=Nonomuraea rhodomycinica TaxID=1712872 RepID=A0A7Y6M9J9_9ACTN|nr:hypothetical protein [Nonomuraea rhodomycinica]NUW38855.1 hypothetical protein [Nonomuraea rhodomycinica]
MALPRIATCVLMLALTAGCGDGDAVTARTPAEAVAQRMRGSAGVHVSRLVRLDYGEKAFTSPAEDDVVPVDIGEYNESRTTGVLGATASDLTATYHRTNVPDELRSVVPTDLSSMTTRTITIAGSGTYEHRADRRDVPAGKSWLHGGGPRCDQMLAAVGRLGLRDLVSPEVLRRLAAPAPSAGEPIDGVTTVVHAGSGSLAQLGHPAPHGDPVLAAQARERRDSTQVSWRLWVGPDRLPRRLHLTEAYPMAEAGLPRSTVIEVDFTGWGTDVLVDPPPADQVHESGSCLDPQPD